MRELIYILMQNPILVLVLVVWVISGIATAAAKAKRAQQQRRQVSPEIEAYRERQLQQQARPVAPPPQRHVAVPQSAEDIARQLREMLGLETEAPPKPAPREPMHERAHEPDAEHEPLEASGEERPRYEEASAGDEDLRHHAGRVGELHEEITKRRQVPTAVTRSVERHIGHRPTKAAVPKPKPAAKVAFDARAAAQAVIALEVLGPPRAFRPYE
jgi:hypothetical protein